VQETGSLSVWERPTRVIMTGFTLGGAGVASVVGATEEVVALGTAAGGVLGVVAVVQLGFSLRRMLRE
jgi:CDP-diacylglycerol--glycerol-3-phosphate 3-phosphatidyltransferase